MTRALKNTAAYLRNLVHNQERIDVTLANELQVLLDDIINNLDNEEVCKQYIDQLLEKSIEISGFE